MKRNEKMTTIVPKEAQRLLAFNNFAGQRHIREGHVDQLAEKMADGRFHIGSIAIVQTDKETLLADGQHQLTACVKSQKPFRAVVQEYTLNGVDDEATVARIFSQFNVDAVRTRGDIAWIYANELGWGTWTRKEVGNLATALSMISSGHFDGHQVPLSKDQAASLLAENRKLCEWVHSLDVSNNKHLLRAPVLAAMLTTHKKAPKVADEFWTAVRDGDQLKRHDPRYLLREYLKDASLQGGQKNPVGREVSNRRCMYAKCIHGWNAWREDRNTALKYHAAAPVPKPV